MGGGFFNRQTLHYIMTRVPPSADRDFTASCYIVKDDHVLLLHHGSLDYWLPPGGHVEDRETPDETALREVKEETGLTVDIIDDKTGDAPDGSHNLPEPSIINLHKIRDGHWHCDFAYVAKPLPDQTIELEQKHHGIEWFDADELRGTDDIPDAVRQRALKALDHSGT